MFDGPSPRAISFHTGRGRIVELLFGAIHLLDEHVAVGERNPILLEHLTGSTSTQNRTRTVVVQVADGNIDPVCG